MIYACWTIRLCRLINAGTHTQWTQQQCSIFADDKHFHWPLRSCKDLKTAVQQLREIIGLTHSRLGMTVNFTISHAVLALKGAKAKQMPAKCTKWWNGARCLVLRVDMRDIHIPIQDTMPYLGAVLSYHSFELQTAQHRIQQANSNFAQLRDVLRTNGALSRARKLDVYRMCVWTSLTYGIASLGATAASCRALQSAAAMHLRLHYFPFRVSAQSSRPSLQSRIFVGNRCCVNQRMSGVDRFTCNYRPTASWATSASGSGPSSG